MNASLFTSSRGRLPIPADTVNEAGGKAYSLSAKEALATYAATGCLNDTYYATGAEQLDKVLELCAKVPATFVAKVAIYARKHAHMKDMPALLMAWLAAGERHEGKKTAKAGEWATFPSDLLWPVFEKVIDNGKMLRNFVQILRSGQLGRKSLGSRPKRLVQRWLASKGDDYLFRASVGNSPSLADVIKMVHPKPSDPTRQALYRYIIGKELNEEQQGCLPALVREFEVYKQLLASSPLPDRFVPSVPFEMLTALSLSCEQWKSIARNAGWQWLRMNLNTLQRHGCFEDPEFVTFVANRLASAYEVAKARVFPYQLLVAFQNANSEIPMGIKLALQDALEHSLSNVPTIPGKVYVCPDVSGSMSSPVTGNRGSATSAVRCVDVAALVTSAILRSNPNAGIMPFEHRVNVPKGGLNPRDSVMTNAQKLASIGGGGTNCAAPLDFLNHHKAHGELVVYISDNESWVDARPGARATATMIEWEKFRSRNPTAKMVCINVQPYETVQASGRPEILNVAGFSDSVFTLLAQFAQGSGPDHWVKEIEAIEI